MSISYHVSYLTLYSNLIPGTKFVPLRGFRIKEASAYTTTLPMNNRQCCHFQSRCQAPPGCFKRTKILISAFRRWWSSTDFSLERQMISMPTTPRKTWFARVFRPGRRHQTKSLSICLFSCWGAYVWTTEFLYTLFRTFSINLHHQIFSALSTQKKTLPQPP